MSFGLWREVSTDVDGDSLEFGCNDIGLISQLFNGVTTGIPAVKIKSTNGFYFCDSTLRFRNPLDTQTLTIRTPAITSAKQLSIPNITVDDTLAVLTTAQTLQHKILDATCDVSAAAGAGGGTGGGTATHKATLYVPLFSYPNWWVGSSTYNWTPLINAIAASPNTDFLVEINVASGPDTAVNTDYSAHGLPDLINAANASGANLKIIGYVSTLYGPANPGGKSLVNAKIDVDRWFSFYGTQIDGIKFDEMDNVTGQESYYQQLSDYTKTKAWDGITMGNPGTTTISSYVPTMDIIIIAEADNSVRPSTANMITRTFNGAYPRTKFSAIIYGQASLDLAYLNTSIIPYADYVYITDDVLANPYDVLPTYLTSLAGAMVSTGGTGVGSSSSFITLGSDPSSSTERILTAGDGITIIDSGPDGTVTVAQNATDVARKRITMIEECLGNPANTTNFAVVVSGTGADVTALAISTAGRFGIWELTTGTTTTGAAAIQLARLAAFSLGSGVVTAEFLLRIPILSTAGEEFNFRIGLLDSVTGVPVDGTYFQYDRPTSVNWRISARSNSTATATNSATAVTAATWTRVKVVVNAAGTSVSFFVNGTEISGSPMTTNIPVGAGREVSLVASIIKSAGTTARTAEIDFISLDVDLTTAR